MGAAKRVMAGLGALALAAWSLVVAVAGYLVWAFRVQGYSTDTGGDHAAQPVLAWALAAIAVVAFVAVVAGAVHLVRYAAWRRGLEPALRAIGLGLALSLAWVVILALASDQGCVTRCALGAPV
jgi:hypothetical protein